MRVASAKGYMIRMREDEDFRKTVNDCEDEAANWELLRQHGYEFTIEELKEAQNELSRELGIACDTAT